MPAPRVGALVQAAHKTKRTRLGAKHYQQLVRSKQLHKHENIGFRGNKHHDKVAKWFRENLRDQKWFQTSIILVIFLAGGLVGLQTYDITDPTTNDVIEVCDTIVMVIFIIEIVVKLIAEGNRPFNFFKDGWNCFDFLIVVVGLLPFGGNAITALRLVRLLRVLKLVRALPKLRILVMGLLKSMSSIAYIGLLLMLLFYLYAVVGVSLFGANDPVLMGNLHVTFLTLFRCATLEDWTDVMYTAMEGCDNYGYDSTPDLCVKPSASPKLAVTYFCSFIILSAMMILNLFIGVITSSMQDAKSDLTAELDADASAAPKDEELMGLCLTDLGTLLETITDEVDVFVALERERQFSSIIQLSNKDMLSNVELKPAEGSSVRPNGPKPDAGPGGDGEVVWKPRRPSQTRALKEALALGQLVDPHGDSRDDMGGSKDQPGSAQRPGEPGTGSRVHFQGDASNVATAGDGSTLSSYHSQQHDFDSQPGSARAVDGNRGAASGTGSGAGSGAHSSGNRLPTAASTSGSTDAAGMQDDDDDDDDGANDAASDMADSDADSLAHVHRQNGRTPHTAAAAAGNDGSIL